MVNESLKWATRKVETQSGEYVTSMVTEHFADGFTIRPTGHMGNKKAHGFHGQASRRWLWTGYLLTDLRVNRPDYVSKSRRFSTVTDAKREAGRRISRAA